MPDAIFMIPLNMASVFKAVLFLAVIAAILAFFFYDDLGFLGGVDEATLRKQMKPIVKPYVDPNFGKPMK
jgi:hypothetical protein